MPELYPKVTKIAGKIISPEIDLLGVDKNNNIINGFEFKLLRYKTRDANLRLLYQGIGQAMLYLNYGIDFSYLVLGMPRNAEPDDLYPKIKMIDALIAFLASYNKFNRLQVWTYDGNNFDHPKPKKIETTWLGIGLSYYINALSRKNLLAGNFTWTKGKNFMKKYRIY